MQVVLISRREAGFHGIMAGNRRFGAAVIATARSCKEFSNDETLLIGSTAVLATLLAAPSPAVAQQPTYPGQNQTEMSPDQSQGQGESTRRKRVNQPETDADQQSEDVSKQRKRERGNQSQTGSKDQSDDEVRTSRRYDRDRHGERRRSREGRYRYFHEGYYYATPWWSVGPGVVVVGGGIGCREGARNATRRGFNRVRPIDCGGETYRYEGWRGGEPWRIRIDSDTGAIVSVRPAG